MMGNLSSSGLGKLDPIEGSCGGSSNHKGEMKSEEKTSGGIPGKLCLLSSLGS